MAACGLLATHARGVATLARLEIEPRRRGKLEDAGTLGSAAGSTHASLAVSLSLLMGLWSLTGNAAPTPGGSLGLSTFATVSGIALVLVFAARATRSAVLGARLVASEIERQLREFSRQPGLATAPADFTPSYRACVEAALSAAREAPILEVGALLLAPFLLGSLTRWTGGPPAAASLVGLGVAAG